MTSVLLLRWELHLPGCRSLKEKRTVVRSLVDRLRSGFNVSVAETELQDVHDRAVVTAVFVTSDGRLADSIADRIDRFVEDRGGAVISQTFRERL